jgi:hypothetical protein
MEHRHAGRRAPGIVALLTLAAASGCADAAAHASRPVATPCAPGSQVFVMEPVWRTNESGNVGRDFHAINTEVTNRILAIVRERCPGAEIAGAGPRDLVHVLPGYPATVDLGAVTAEEQNAAARAYERGAAYLLVPTITEWKEMRAGDPIGALILPHNSVAMTLRLMRLNLPALTAYAGFKNRARLTLNQPADQLLNGRFHDVVLGLLAGGT